MRLPVLLPYQIIHLYRAWSEKIWFTSFMPLPEDGTLSADFLAWVLEQPFRQQWESYESDLLRRWWAEEKKRGN